MTDENTCFVISPIGEEESETREQSDTVFEYIIEAALEEFNYSPIRADQIAEPGIITNDIIEYLVESPLVIADLTESNANVFYELAIRHAYEKPTIQIIQEGESIPFDVAATRTIHFDLEDIVSVEKAKDEIKSQIESIENEEETFENPITVAESIKNLKQSSDPEERSMADIMETMTDLKGDLRAIETTLSNPQELLPPEYINEITQQLNDNEINKARAIVKKIEYIMDEMSKKVENSEINDEEVEHLRLEYSQYIKELEKMLSAAHQSQVSLSEIPINRK